MIVLLTFVVLFSTFPAKFPNVSFDCIVGIQLSCLMFTSSSTVCVNLCLCIIAMFAGEW